MITKDIKIFIKFRKELISNLANTFNSELHEESRINYNYVADNIIKLIDTYEQKINRSEIDINE